MTSYTRQMLDLRRHKDSIGIICYQCRTLIPIGSEVAVPARDIHYKKTYHRDCAKRINLMWDRLQIQIDSGSGTFERQSGDIAAELQVPLTDVNRDLKYLRLKAKQNIQDYIDEYLPAEYQYCLDALNMIVKEMWAIKTEDNRELMQSRSLIKDCCAMRIELLSNATVVDRAVQFVDRHRGLIPQNKEVTIDDTLVPP